jgi:hypothetical protein
MDVGGACARTRRADDEATSRRVNKSLVEIFMAIPPLPLAREVKADPNARGA